MKRKLSILLIIVIAIIGTTVIYKHFYKQQIDNKSVTKFSDEYTLVDKNNVFVYSNIDEVANIDFAKETNNLINNQTNDLQGSIDSVSTQLENIENAILDSNIIPNNTASVDLSEVTTLIEDIDTTVVEAKTQDVLNLVFQQQEQINRIEEKLDTILDKM